METQGGIQLHNVATFETCEAGPDVGDHLDSLEVGAPSRRGQIVRLGSLGLGISDRHMLVGRISPSTGTGSPNFHSL
jgi:hypothetical protein